MSCNGNIDLVKNDLIIYMDEFSNGNKMEKMMANVVNINSDNSEPSHSPEIVDLEPDERPVDSGSNDKDVDDEFFPELPKNNEPPVKFPKYPKNTHKHYPAFLPGYLPRHGPLTPDVNVYQQKKTIAQGMMDLALISANANQFRYVLQSSGNHPYYYPSLAMIGLSLILQVAIGIGLIWNSRYNVKVDSEMCKANRASNWTIIGIFSVTILNVFISSFGVAESVDKSTI